VSARHRQVLKTLDAGIQDGRGVLLLIGEGGSGKTVLTRALLNGLVGTGVRVGWLPSPDLELAEFHRVLGEGLPDGETPSGDFPEAFRRYLRDVAVQGQRILLVIDDAHALRPELFAELQRLLEVDQHPNGDQIGTFNILLVGRSELASLLREPQHATLAMRIKVRCPLGPLTSDEVGRYVAHHLGAAGLGFNWFTQDAIEEICAQSGGLPRTINLICQRALRAAQQAGASTVDAALIRRSIAAEMAGDEPRAKGIVRTLLELPRPLQAEPPRAEPEGSTSRPDHPAGEDRRRRLVRVGGATALVALVAGFMLYLGWWSPSPKAARSSASSVVEPKVERVAPVDVPEKPAEPPVPVVSPPAPLRAEPAPATERSRALAGEKTPQPTTVSPPARGTTPAAGPGSATGKELPRSPATDEPDPTAIIDWLLKQSPGRSD
jgi:type II secretory pathway predicted ATPase ExeA